MSGRTPLGSERQHSFLKITRDDHDARITRLTQRREPVRHLVSFGTPASSSVLTVAHDKMAKLVRATAVGAVRKPCDVVEIHVVDAVDAAELRDSEGAV